MLYLWIIFVGTSLFCINTIKRITVGMLSWGHKRDHSKTKTITWITQRKVEVTPYPVSV